MAWTFPALQTKFRNILLNHGQNAYLRRRCVSCEQTPPFAHHDDTCSVCGGTGYRQAVERYTMRKWIIGAQNSFPKSMIMTDIGTKLDEGTYFFMEGSVNPRYGDLVYDWNNATQEFDVYEIEKVIPRRFDNRVLFYVAAGEIKVALKPS